jgi:hypothetical protein
VTEFDIDALPSDWEALTSAGRAMTEAADLQRWQLGDLANKVTRTYGAESLKTFAGEINIANHKMLWDYSRVAARFEKSVRNEFPALSFTHFRTAMRAKDDAELFLVQAQDNGWPVAVMAREIAAAIGKPVPPRKLWEGEATVWHEHFPLGDITHLACGVAPLPEDVLVRIVVYEVGVE